MITVRRLSSLLTDLRALLLAGLLLRLLLMPACATDGLVERYSAAYHDSTSASQTGSVPTTSALEDVVHSMSLAALSPLLPSPDLMLPRSAGEGVDWTELVRTSTLPRVAFVLKLPYLAAEICCLLFLLLMMHGSARPDKSARMRKMAALWIFNPLVLLPVYVWGGAPVIGLALLMGGVAMWTVGGNDRRLRLSGGVMLGLAACYHHTLLLLALVLVVAVYESAGRRLRSLGVMITTMGVVGVLLWGGALFTLEPWTLWLERLQLQAGATFTINAHPLDRLSDFLPLYPLLASVLLLLVFTRVIQFEKAPLGIAGLLLIVVAVGAALTPFELGWILLVAPWWCFEALSDDRHLVLMGLFTIGVVIHSWTLGPSTGAGLLAPIFSAEALQVTSPRALLAEAYDAERLFALARTGIAAVGIGASLLAWKTAVSWNFEEV